MLVLLVSVLLVIIYILVVKSLKSVKLFYRQYQMLKSVPGPPIDSIFLGHSNLVLASQTELPRRLGKMVEEYRGLFTIWVFNQPYVMISSAEYAEKVFNSKELSTKADIYGFLHIWLGTGLLTSQGQLWQQRRKLITPAFHFSILNIFSEVIIDNSLALMKKLKEIPKGDSVNVFKMIHLVALENICETAMGIKINALDNPKMEYVRAIEETTQAIMDRMQKPWYWNDTTYFMTPVGRKLKKNLDIIFGLTNKVIEDKMSKKSLEPVLLEPFTNEDEENDDSKGKKKQAFLDLLIEACESESIPLSNTDLRDEVNTFMFEGHDTTAVAMSFTLYLLGLHPEVQGECHKELENIFHGSRRRPTSDDLQKMKFLDQVIRESLRLFPSVPLLCRQVTHDTQLGKYTLPEGSLALMNVFHLHRDPKYFPNPEKFDPNRFTVENLANRHPFAYVPFSAGSRNCIGQKFAMMEEKIVLSYILRSFYVESIGSLSEVEPSFTLILRSEKSLDVRFIPR